MKQITGLLLSAAFLSLGACGSGAPADEVTSPAEDSNPAAFNDAPDETLSAADAAQKNANLALEKAEAAEPKATLESSAPSYDLTTYCRKIGDTAGGSSMIEKSCRDMESEALDAIQSRSIPERVRNYCDKIGKTAGGSYSIYNSCVDMEMEAAGSL